VSAARLVYRVPEVAELLGVCDESVYRLIREGTLQARQQRRFIVVTRADLDAYVEALPVLNAPAPPLPAPEPQRSGGRSQVTRLFSPVRGAPPVHATPPGRDRRQRVQRLVSPRVDLPATTTSASGSRT
jgi:excisionase family DNA binding protein